MRVVRISVGSVATGLLVIQILGAIKDFAAKQTTLVVGGLVLSFIWALAIYLSIKDKLEP